MVLSIQEDCFQAPQQPRQPMMVTAPGAQHNVGPFGSSQSSGQHSSAEEDTGCCQKEAKD